MLKDQNSVDSFFDSTTYHLNKKCLILAGGWPFLNPRKRKTIWLAINFSLFIGFVAEIIYIGEIIDRTTEVINCLMVICCAILAFCLSINGAVKSHSGAIGTVVAVWMLVAYDLFFVVVVLHCCGMFAVLRYKIKQMDIVLYRYSYDRQLAVKKIEEIVMYHLKCLEFAQKIEDFFCIQCIIQILVNTIVISVIQLADTSPQESFKFAFVGCSGTFRLAFFNVCGQIVNDQSLRVHDQLIYTTWYEYPIRARKLFVILYNRSAEPCNLTGAKMVNLNLATYSALMKTAMSYFMMIIETQ
uniref:Odorant receptor n=1 Tax=Trichogramma kaykai TaxID=54128 RepID=A0ABD2WWB8_9HYME